MTSDEQLFELLMDKLQVHSSIVVNQVLRDVSKLIHMHSWGAGILQSAGRASSSV
jgi:hypothetical protein